mgnify:CR=1 FL=1|tara:strand:- start:1116 stop:1361 length:246 start_codon:yes stop_codon:yes gene_type:complete
MKVENLKKAELLREELRVVDWRIKTVEESKYVKMDGKINFDVSTEEMKYDSSVLLDSVKPLFLNALNRERQDVLSEIDLLD